jgi:hypothetical protein
VPGRVPRTSGVGQAAAKLRRGQVYVGFFASRETAQKAIAVAHEICARKGGKAKLHQRVRQELEKQGVIPPKQDKSPRDSHGSTGKGAAPRRGRSAGTYGYKGESLLPGLSCCPPPRLRPTDSPRASRAGVTPLEYLGYTKYWARVEGKSLGKFDTAEEAARVYDKKARKLRLPMYQLNFPDADKGKGPRDRLGHDDSSEPDGTSSRTHWRRLLI